MQHLGEQGVLVLACSPPGIDDYLSKTCKGEEVSEAAAVEGAKAKAALPPFEPFSPAQVESASDMHLKIRKYETTQ